MHPSLSAGISAAPTGRISVKFDIAVFHENLPGKNQILVKIVQTYSALCMNFFRVFNIADSYIQGGSNMTGTDLYVNKPHCAAAVRR